MRDHWPKKQSGQRVLPILLAVVGVTALAVGLVLWNPPQPGGGPDWVSLRGSELKRLGALAVEGTGYLENEVLDRADAALLEVARKLPDQRLGPQNLSVCRLLAYQGEQGDAAALEQAIAMLRAIDPDSSAADWLQAKAARHTLEQATDEEVIRVNQQLAIDALRAATENDPDNVVFHFELYDAAYTSDDEQVREIAAAALQNAYEIAPDNLFLLSHYLVLQAERENPELGSILRKAKEVIAPLRERVLRQKRADIEKLVDAAIEAADAQDWQKALLNTRIVFVNLIRSDDFAQSDLRRLQPHPLEFVVHTFDEDLQVKIHPVKSPEGDGIEVAFAPWLDSWEVSLAAEVRAVRAEDFDLDGKLDLFALLPERLVVLGHQESGWSEIASVELGSGAQGILVADLDHDRDLTLETNKSVCFDADVDLIIYGSQGFSAYRNEVVDGVRKLSLIAQDDTLPSQGAVENGILVDFDHDSDLDLVMIGDQGIRALLNQGNAKFVDATQFSILPAPEEQPTDLVAVDWDRDVDIDVVVTFGSSENVGILENLRHGNFRWQPLGPDFASLNPATAIALLDSDANGSWDLAAACENELRVVETTTLPGGTVNVLDKRTLPARGVSDLLVWDFDNDGVTDFLARSQTELTAIRGRNQQSMSLPSQVDVQAFDVEDLDNDGDLDVVVATATGIRLWENQGGNENHWLRVRAVGQVDNKGKVNHNGIGSLLELRTPNRYQAHVVQRPTSHFGLGAESQAELLRFLWTNGIPQTIVQPEADQLVCELMVLKGSCPYVYAWNGERFEFVTDLLWAAPIGLQFAEGVIAPSREWEHLLIPGTQLQPSPEGKYQLRVTEELWEAAYFDQVELWAVDRPAELLIATNEKVGPAEIAEHKIHTVRQPRTPVAARDQRGNDVLATIAERDHRYFRGYQRQILPGLVDAHYLEIDLGADIPADDVMLFLTGWIYPTDTSLNIALSQDPELSAPRPPYVSVVDQDGQWREVIDYMGFPGGKTKTIAVDLSGKFLSEDRRVRIQTSSQICWDHVYFATGEAPATLEVQPLELMAAGLRYRGFSARIEGQHNGPEDYNYEEASSELRWPPMRGKFTRYGEVKQLLAKTDGQLVVLGSGDEILLEFAAPAKAIPPGWERDFVLRNVGWDKDADLNTIDGQTVEPLPFVGMKQYPPLTAPDTPAYQDYLRRYQTRDMQSGDFWRRVTRPAR